MIDNLLDIIFLMAFLFLADTYYIGIIPLLFCDDVFLNPLKIKCHYKIVAQTIDTNCHDRNRNIKRITKFFEGANSRIAICEEGIFIGKKYLSYAYKLKYEDISEASLEIVNRYFLNVANIKISVNNDNCECFYLIRYYTVFNINITKVNRIINYIVGEIGES